LDEAQAEQRQPSDAPQGKIAYTYHCMYKKGITERKYDRQSCYNHAQLYAIGFILNRPIENFFGGIFGGMIVFYNHKIVYPCGFPGMFRLPASN